MRVDEQLMALADHLQAERSSILLSWQESVAQDPELTTSSTISRTQFNDHIPQVLEAFEHRLRAKDPTERHQARQVALAQNMSGFGQPVGILHWKKDQGK